MWLRGPLAVPGPRDTFQVRQVRSLSGPVPHGLAWSCCTGIMIGPGPGPTATLTAPARGSEAGNWNLNPEDPASGWQLLGQPEDATCNNNSSWPDSARPGPGPRASHVTGRHCPGYTARKAQPEPALRMNQAPTTCYKDPSR